MPGRRLPRLLVVVVLPVLFGGFLLMHGVDASSSGGGHSGTAAAAVDTHDSEHRHGEGLHCSDCLTHAMAACLAVVAALAALRIVRGWTAAAVTVAGLASGFDTVRERWELWHPPEPAWIRLAVMRS